MHKYIHIYIYIYTSTYIAYLLCTDKVEASRPTGHRPRGKPHAGADGGEQRRGEQRGDEGGKEVPFCARNAEHAQQVEL